MNDNNNYYDAPVISEFFLKPHKPKYARVSAHLKNLNI